MIAAATGVGEGISHRMVFVPRGIWHALLVVTRPVRPIYRPVRDAYYARVAGQVARHFAANLPEDPVWFRLTTGPWARWYPPTSDTVHGWAYRNEVEAGRTLRKVHV